MRKFLRRKKGSRSKHGYSISEMNHSSILVHMNEWLSHGTHYSEKTHILFRVFLVLARKTYHFWNQQMHYEYNNLRLLRSKINKESDPHLYHTSDVFCLASI